MATLIQHRCFPRCYLLPIFILQSLLLFIGSESAAISSSVVLPGSAACDAKNRDPCSTFPGLCSTGGGLCVFKGPCEYECICPPDGRRGRDCTGSDDVVNNPREEIGEPSNGESLLDSLLVFPQDLFWDLNHVLRPEESVKMMQSTPPPSYTSEVSATSAATSLDLANSTGTSFENGTTADSQTIVGDKNETVDVITNSMTRLDSTQNRPLQDQTRLAPNDVTRIQASTTQPSPTTMNEKSTETDVTTVSLTPTESMKQTSLPTTPSVPEAKPQNPTHNNKAAGIDNALSLREINLARIMENGAFGVMFRASPTENDDDQSRATEVDELSITNPVTTTSISLTSSTPTPSFVPPTDSPLPVAKVTNDASTNKGISVNTSPKTSLPSNIQSRKPDYVTTSTPTSQTNPLITNRIDLLKILGTTVDPTTFTRPGSLREVFPGHESFPTFFRDNIEDKTTKEDGPPNMAISKRVHRVFFPISQFEKIERRRGRRGRGGG